MIEKKHVKVFGLSVTNQYRTLNLCDIDLPSSTVPIIDNWGSKPENHCGQARVYVEGDGLYADLELLERFKDYPPLHVTIGVVVYDEMPVVDLKVVVLSTSPNLDPTVLPITFQD